MTEVSDRRQEPELDRRPDRRADGPRPDLDLGALCWEQLIKSESCVEMNIHLIHFYS